jgi:hypothetical protein
LECPSLERHQKGAETAHRAWAGPASGREKRARSAGGRASARTSAEEEGLFKESAVNEVDADARHDWHCRWAERPCIGERQTDRERSFIDNQDVTEEEEETWW